MINHSNNPFITKSQYNQFKMPFQLESRMNAHPFIDNCLSEIGLKIGRQEENDSQNESLLKMRNQLQMREQQFIQDNNTDDDEKQLQIKKPRSQMFSNKKQHNPPSPKSHFSREQIHRQQYVLSAQRKNRSKDKKYNNSLIIRDNNPIFEIFRQPFTLSKNQVNSNRKEFNTLKFTQQQFQIYKKVKWIVTQAMMIEQESRQELSEKYQLTKVIDELRKLDNLLKRRKCLIEKLQKYTILGKQKQKSLPQGINSHHNQSDQLHHIHQRLQQLQRATNSLLSEESQYQDYLKELNNNNNNHHILHSNRDQEKRVIIKNTFNIKKGSLCYYQSDYKERQLEENSSSNNIYQQLHGNNNSIKTIQTKGLTLIDEYRQKLSSSSITANQSIQINHLFSIKDHQKQSQTQIIFKSDNPFCQRLKKALLPISKSISCMTKSMTMGKVSLVEFIESQNQRKIKEQVQKYYQSKQGLEQLMEMLKGRSKLFQQGEQKLDNSLKYRRLLKWKRYPQVVNLTTLITPNIYQHSISQKNIQLKNLLPQQCRTLILLINNNNKSNINESKRNQLTIKESLQHKQQDLPIHPIFNIPLQPTIIKSISIGASHKLDSNSCSKNFSNQGVNSVQFYNHNKNDRTNNNNDKIKGNLLLNEQRNYGKMTNSVILKNDVKGIQTYRNGGGNKTIRQGMSMRFTPYPTTTGLSSQARKSNYSPPKKANNFTNLPSLEDDLRRQAIQLYMPQQGMDAVEYIAQGIQQKIQKYIRENSGGHNKCTTGKQNQKKSLYVSKQEREIRKYEEEMMSQNKQRLLGTEGMQLWEIRLNELNKEKKWLTQEKQFKDQEVYILDSSLEEEQRAKRFFKINENGLSKQLFTLKPSKEQQNTDRYNNNNDNKNSNRLNNKSTNNKSSYTIDNKSPLFAYMKSMQQEQDNFRWKNTLQPETVKSNKIIGNNLVIHNSYLKNIGGSKEIKEQGKIEVSAIAEVQSENSQLVSEQKIIIRTKEQTKIEEKERLPSFNMQQKQLQQKQTEKKGEEVKSTAVNIFQQQAEKQQQQKKVNIFTINKPKQQQPQSQLQKPNQILKKTEQEQKNKQQIKAQNKASPTQQKGLVFPNKPPSPQQQKQEKTISNTPPLPPKQQQASSQPQFASFNPQQFQDAFKPTTNLKTFNSFQSQQPNNQNIFQQIGQQIGQHLQNQTQTPQQTFESFGPAAFMGNPQLPFLQNQSSGQEKNIFSQPNMFTGPANQQTNTTNVNPFNIIHQSIQSSQQKNIFGSNNPQQGNIFGSQNGNQQQNNIFGQKNIFGSQNQQQQGNPFQDQKQKQQVNIFGQQGGKSNIFAQQPNSQQQPTNVFFGQQQQQTTQNIPKNYMQPRK